MRPAIRCFVCVVVLLFFRFAAPAVARRINSNALLITPQHQPRPRRGTDMSAGISLREDNALFRQRSATRAVLDAAAAPSRIYMKKILRQEALEHHILHGLSLEWETALWVLDEPHRQRMSPPLFCLRDYSRTCKIEIWQKSF